MGEEADRSAAANWNGANVQDLFRLEQLDCNLFRNHFNQRNANNSLFGGQVLAQSLTAAIHTVADQPDGRLVHSLHGYFLRAGRAESPVIYEVERTRDGGHFSTRRVVAVQEGTPIFHMECGFHAPEAGFDHQFLLPSDAASPEELRDFVQLLPEFGPTMPAWLRDHLRNSPQPVEARPVHPESFFHSGNDNARRSVWMRVPSARGATPAVQSATLAWFSDHWLAGTAALPHVAPDTGPGLFIASLDHAMWFHRPVQADEWLLFDTESPSAQSGRGLARGLIFARDGSLVATVAQEALLRRRR